MKELRERESAVSRSLRAECTLGLHVSSATSVAGEQARRARPLVRGVVTRRYAAACANVKLEGVRPNQGEGLRLSRAKAA